MDQPLSHCRSAAVSFTRSALFCIACVLYAPSQAAAWCRASAEVTRTGECVQSPTAPLLSWKRSCTAYAFNADFFDQIEAMSEPEARAAFRASFDAWAEVSCAGRAPFLVEQLAGTTSTAQSEWRREGPNESVVVGIDEETWTTLPDHSARAVALTLMWHNRRTGEILDTDIELNLGAGKFADCVAGSCSAGMVDLQNTITHEAGHVLGLGHSADRSATMTAQQVGTVESQKRSLAPDDSAGYCALELPAHACSAAGCSCAEVLAMLPSSATSRTSCEAAAPGAGRSGWLWLLAALGCMRCRARARRNGEL